MLGWGRNSFGESSPPPGAFTTIGCGSWHSLAVRTDGLIVGFGWNGTGQLSAPRLEGVQLVVAGWKHSLALDGAGKIRGWGEDVAGVLNDIPLDGSYIDLDCSAGRGIALRSDGQIVTWGTSSNWKVPAGTYRAVTAGYSIECAIACGCPADIVTDGSVNGADLATVLVYWGTNGGQYPRADIDGNGVVNGSDLAAVLAAWGPCPQ